MKNKNPHKLNKRINVLRKMCFDEDEMKRLSHIYSHTHLTKRKYDLTLFRFFALFYEFVFGLCQEYDNAKIGNVCEKNPVNSLSQRSSVARRLFATSVHGVLSFNGML